MGDFVVAVPLALMVYLVFSFLIVAFENGDQYVEAAGVMVVTVLVMSNAAILPGLAGLRPVSAGRRATKASARELWAPPTPVRVGHRARGGE